MMLNEGDLQAIWLTVRLAATVTAILLLIGTPIAWWLARSKAWWKGPIAAVVAMPLVLPPSVLGFYLLLAMGPHGPVGQLTEALGLGRLPFTFWGLVVAFAGYGLAFSAMSFHLIPLLDELSDRAQQLQAVNTVVFQPDGRRIGHNTDWCGYQKPFADALPGACQGTVVQLGAGGAGAAVAYATLDLGTPLLIVHDIDAARSAALVERMQGSVSVSSEPDSKE